MAVPDFQSIMLPMLHLASDQREHSLAESRERLASEFNLSEEDQTKLLPSGRQAVWANRVAWANVYLRQAKLLDSTRRGHFKITPRGGDVLAKPPDRIDIKFLEQYPEFYEFRYKRGKSIEVSETSEKDESETPDETLEEAYLKLRSSLAQELLAKIKEASPQFFERLVVEVLLRMGYGGSRKDAGRALGRSGDEGIDGTIYEDRLGLDVIYLQAKRWEGTVGRPEVQKFVGALHGKRARKGVFLTTGSFSADATEYVSHIDPKVVLIDGSELAELMIDHGVGVSTVTTYEIKRLDTDYFTEE
jgi:restriction system protein